MELIIALETLAALIGRVQQVSAVIGQVVADGRKELSEEEWAAIVAADDAARVRLVEALKKREEEKPE